MELSRPNTAILGIQTCLSFRPRSAEVRPPSTHERTAAICHLRTPEAHCFECSSIAGNIKNSSDAIGAVDALYQTIDHCLKQRDIVIVDGFRSSNKLVRWVEEHPLQPAALFVYLNLSLDENVDRLRKRRSANGTVEERLPNKTFRNLLRFRDRASGVWQYAREHYERQPARYLEIPEGSSPEETALLVEGALAEAARPIGSRAYIDQTFFANF